MVATTNRPELSRQTTDSTGEASLSSTLGSMGSLADGGAARSFWQDARRKDQSPLRVRSAVVSRYDLSWHEASAWRPWAHGWLGGPMSVRSSIGRCKTPY